ncbi:serpin family protein [Halorussus halophilus]|uniref:serpin family protein n=1 Tax=Halorussus halophilus TaxID=2650975 RepID=UPI001301442B|nr:serpin family protein [Halorussus halophilus]
MALRRREALGLTGALLAGLAGCTGSGDDQNSDTPTKTMTENNDTSEDETTRKTTTDTEEQDFERIEVPPFPKIDPVTDPELSEDLLADQIRGNVEFTLDLLSVLREDADSNLFFSPYSISVALAMTYAGAGSNTEKEMAEALHYVLDQERLHPAFGSLETEFEQRNEDGRETNRTTREGKDPGPAFEFTTGNAVWGQEEYPFREAYLELLDAYYQAGLNLVDFSGSPEEARTKINEWVAEQTNDRIEDLLPQGSIDQTTKLVLTNAVYFKSRWQHTFDEEDTTPKPFTALDGTTTKVPTMHQSLKTSHAQIDGHQLVELKYANYETSMVVVLPAEGEFESFEQKFTVDRLAIMLEQASQARVDLALPKFEIESEFSLVKTMQELGMEDAFSGAADFSGMADGGGGLSISDIRHKSFVSVDELGTEAAAATAVAVATSAPPKRVEMTVDRPFLFYIRDRPTETPLFVGRVTELGD